MKLTPRDEAMLSGREGPAPELAMSILVRMGEIQGAEEMLDISRAHVDSTLYVGDASLDFAERLAELGARVSVPTTLNVSGLDEAHWREWSVSPGWAEKARRQMSAYESMGTVPTWTCAPYQTPHAPKLGEQIAWGESNAIVFANSVLGARTERYPDLLDICAAIAGRVPAVGLHLAEHRAGQVRIGLADIPESLQREDSFYPVLGHLLGRIAGDRVPVLEGLSVLPTEDQLKALGAAAASSGTVALFHVVGLTPEAPTSEVAFQHREPEESVEVDLDGLAAARDELTTAEGAALDMVALGSPHFSLAEFEKLAPLLRGKTRHPGVELVVTTSRFMAALARKKGLLAPLEDFGGRLMLDTCVLAMPMLPHGLKVIMTSSGKYAYYAPGLLRTEVVFGSLEDCVHSAIAGRVVRDDSLWKR